jgi:hypothetical protein
MPLQIKIESLAEPLLNLALATVLFLFPLTALLRIPPNKSTDNKHEF